MPLKFTIGTAVKQAQFPIPESINRRHSWHGSYVYSADFPIHGIQIPKQLLCKPTIQVGLVTNSNRNAGFAVFLCGGVSGGTFMFNTKTTKILYYSDICRNQRVLSDDELKDLAQLLTKSHRMQTAIWSYAQEVLLKSF